MNLLWRSCSRNQLSKSLGASFPLQKRVASVESSTDVQYQIFAQPKFKTCLLGLVSREQRQREFVHLLTQNIQDFDHAMTSFVEGAANPRADWQFAKFKIVLRSCGEVHRIVLVRRASEEAKPELEAAAACLIQGLSCTESLDLDTWSATLTSLAAAVGITRKPSHNKRQLSMKHQLAHSQSQEWHMHAQAEALDSLSPCTSCRSSRHT